MKPMIQAMLFLCFVVNSTITLAADCKTTAKELDQQHRKLVNELKSDKRALIEGLYKIEDQAFKSIQSCKTNTHFLAAMADLQLSLGQAPLALLYAQKAIGVDDNNWQAHHVTGTILTYKEDYLEGLKHLEKASTLNPKNYALMINLCSSYEQNFKHDEAIAACGLVINKGPYELHGPAYYIRARAYAARGEHTLAKKDDQLAIEFGFRPETNNASDNNSPTTRDR